jgi:hypothetical protein
MSAARCSFFNFIRNLRLTFGCGRRSEGHAIESRAADDDAPSDQVWEASSCQTLNVSRGFLRKRTRERSP